MKPARFRISMQASECVMCSVASFAMRVIRLRWEKLALPYGELLWIISINQLRTADIKLSYMQIGLGLTAPQHEVPAC
jgi:hypothetical protein